MKGNEESRHCFRSSLESRKDAKGKSASRANRVAGKQSSEVDKFERVAYVCDIALKPGSEFFTLEETLAPTVRFCVKVGA